MKKVLVLIVSLTLTLGSQAQLDGLVRQTVKKGLEQKLSLKQQPKKVNDQSMDSQKNRAEEEKGAIPTPEEVMAMVPAIPQAQHLADYICEQNRANPRTLKLIANPTTAFMAQMVTAMASGYVVMMGAGQPGSVYAFDEQLLKEFNITPEQYEAMSEEEQQELAVKFADELKERYYRTSERLMSDETYNNLMEQYRKIEEEIQNKYSDVDSLCSDMWKKKMGSKENPSEDEMCEYIRVAVQMQYKVVLEVMKIRKLRQLEVAKKIDAYVQELAKAQPNEVYAVFFNQGGLCATSYVSDAARLTSMSVPR